MAATREPIPFHGGMYTGEITDSGTPNGKGAVTFDSGETLSGTFNNGVPNGKCRRSWSDGLYIEQMWDNGKSSDEGKIVQPGVGTIEGTIFGRGKCRIDYDNSSMPKGSYYEGECADHEPDGWGKQVLAGLSECEGEWRNGEQHGYCINKFSDASAAKVGKKNGWTAEGIVIRDGMRKWWIRTGSDSNNGKPEVINVSNENFHIPKEDYDTLGVKARLFLGFIEMYIEKSRGLESLSDNLLSQPIEKKAEVYYSWLLGKMNAAKSGSEYAVLAQKFSDISEYKDCAALADKCKQKV